VTVSSLSQSDQALVDSVLDQLEPTARARALRAPQRIVDEGSAYRVVLRGLEIAVRIARDSGTRALMEQRQHLVDALPPLGVRVPSSLTPVVTVGQRSAVGVVAVSGAPVMHGTVDGQELARLLTTLQRVDLGPLRPLLAPPLQFCGGTTWHRVQHELVIPRLRPEARDRARRAVDALHELPADETDVLSHGDLGGANLLWNDGRISGVIDWDLASASDRSTDIATLALWFGDQSMRVVATERDLERARIRQRTFALQQVAFSLLAQRAEHEIDDMVARVEPWMARFEHP